MKTLLKFLISNVHFLLTIYNEGAGQLQYYSDPPYLPNDEYPLKQKQFRLYYTSKASESHQFSIWIKDSFGNERRVDYEFDNAS